MRKEVTVSLLDGAGKHESRSNNSFPILAVSLGLGLVFDWLFFGKLPGVSFPIYIVLVVASLLGVARWRRQKLPDTALFMIPLLLFFSTMDLVRASGFIMFMNAVVTLFVLGLLVTLTGKPRLGQFGLADYARLLVELPLQIIDRSINTLSDLVSLRNFVRRHQAFPQVLRGVLLAAMGLLIFGALFASADLVFRELIGNIFSLSINDQLVARTIIVLLVAVTFVGLLGALGRRLEKAVSLPQADSSAGRGRSGLIEVSILFGTLNVLFFGFIVVQLAYLFGGANNIIGEGFTYAEYARKGFFELIAATGLTFLLILVVDRQLLSRAARHGRMFKLLAGGLVIQVMVVMLSAFKRLLLYEGAYGLTSLRLVCHALIVWLAVVFCVLLYKIVADKRENVFAFALFISVLLLCASLNVLNVDSFVARKNVDRFEAGGKLDLAYLGTLSEDATPQIVRLLDSKNSDVRRQVADLLSRKRHAMTMEGSDWQSLNLSRQQALELLDAKAPALERYKTRL